MNKLFSMLVVCLTLSSASYAEQNDRSIVDKVSVMGVRLCSSVIKTGQQLEDKGYEGSARLAKMLNKVSNATKVDDGDSQTFSINSGNIKKNTAVNQISYVGTLKNAAELFQAEKLQFEQETGLKLECHKRAMTHEIHTECKYPSGDPDPNKPSFLYMIEYREISSSLYISASAWKYNGC